VCGLLDSYAFRRSGGQPLRQFPQGLVDAMKRHPTAQERIDANGNPLLDTRYLRVREDASTPQEKYLGGLFSLDGIHPTTVFYGIVADYLLGIINQQDHTPHQLDWDAIVAADPLITDPPLNVTRLKDMLGFLSSQGPFPELLMAISGVKELR
jgi:hypothetical protein